MTDIQANVGLKINLGSFTCMYHGWINLDVVPLGAWAHQNKFDFLAHDLRMGIPFHNDSVSFIFSSHFLEHLNYMEGLNFLIECKRVMMPGAIMRLAVPDTEILAKHYLNKDTDFLCEINEPCKSFPKSSMRIWHVLTDNHQSAYDMETMQYQASLAGFTKVTRKAFNERHAGFEGTQDLFESISLYVEIEK